MVPILDYGAVVWSHPIPAYTLEKVQKRACRGFLGVSRLHPLAAVDGHMCWMPTQYRQQLQCIRLCCLLVRSGEKCIKLVYKNACTWLLLSLYKTWFKMSYLLEEE